MKLRKGDTVLVTAGKDKGKKGKVRTSIPGVNKVVVEGANIIKKHARVRAGARQGGIIERESPLQASNVMLVCTKCEKPTRVGMRFLEDGKKTRFCRVCKEIID
jgi:large subunit ribosomal protein L24